MVLSNYNNFSIMKYFFSSLVEFRVVPRTEVLIIVLWRRNGGGERNGRRCER